MTLAIGTKKVVLIFWSWKFDLDTYLQGNNLPIDGGASVGATTERWE